MEALGPRRPARRRGRAPKARGSRCREGLGVGRGLPSPPREGFGEGAMPSPHNFFAIFELKKASFGAFWD